MLRHCRPRAVRVRPCSQRTGEAPPLRESRQLPQKKRTIIYIYRYKYTSLRFSLIVVMASWTQSCLLISTGGSAILGASGTTCGVTSHVKMLSIISFVFSSEVSNTSCSGKNVTRAYLPFLIWVTCHAHDALYGSRQLYTESRWHKIIELY